MAKNIVTPVVTNPQSDEALDTLVALASDSARWTERDARYFIDKISQIEEADTWRRRLQGEPKTWRRFCSEVLGYDAGYIEKIRGGLDILERAGIMNGTIGQAITAQQRAEHAKELGEREIGISEGKAGPGRGHKTGDIITRFHGDRGTAPDYLTARIARDRPDILERMRAGEYTSVRAAALDAGIVKRRISIPTDVDGAARALRRHFTEDELAIIKANL